MYNEGNGEDYGCTRSFFKSVSISPGGSTAAWFESEAWRTLEELVVASSGRGSSLPGSASPSAVLSTLFDCSEGRVDIRAWKTVWKCPNGALAATLGLVVDGIRVVNGAEGCA